VAHAASKARAKGTNRRVGDMGAVAPAFTTNGEHN
jgi:hypothetical protein